MTLPETTTEVEVYEPFENDREVRIEYCPIMSQFTISHNIPVGIVDRGENAEMTMDDVEFLKWLVNSYSNWDFDETIQSERNNLKLAYIIELIVSTAMGTEPAEWSGFEGETDNYINRGTLGVQ